MNTLLTKADIEYLLTQQEKLDEDIRNKKQITYQQWTNIDFDSMHGTALYVEKAELINECHDLWKYWKSKPVNKDKILDEAIDCIHFLMLIANKKEETPESILDRIDDGLDFVLKNYDVNAHLMAAFIRAVGFEINIAIIILLLDHYGFTSKDIIDAYNRKNKVNFERLESGY